VLHFCIVLWMHTVLPAVLLLMPCSYDAHYYFLPMQLTVVAAASDPLAACSSMEPRDFVEVAVPRLGEMFSACLEEPELMHIFSALAGAGSSASAPGGTASSTAPQIARAFTLHMLDHLLAPSHLDLLGRMGTREAAASLKAIKMLLAPLSAALADMEPVIAPRLARCVERCLAAATTANEPIGYLQLLRSILKVTVGLVAQKRSVLQQALAPLLPSCLRLFIAMLDGPNSTELRPLLLELCLTLPFQPDALPPSIPKLVRPMLNALTQVKLRTSSIALMGRALWVCSSMSRSYALTQCNIS
jgi:transformation/transcription domain-associated protein